jgi:LPXTG-motif cell wall-anchored protein
VFLAVATVSILLLAFTAVAGAQTQYPPSSTAPAPVPSTAPAQAAARRLAVTGDNHTMTYVLVGITVLVVGAVLVVMSRRRRAVA